MLLAHGGPGPVHELDFDAGVTWTDEEPVFLPGLDYFGAVAGATYAWKINEVASFRERLVLYPNFDESDDWRLRSETSLDAALAASWALRVGYLFTRDNARFNTLTDKLDELREEKATAEDRWLALAEEVEALG